MLLAEGVGRTLAPEVNMWELSRPLIEKWMREELGPEAKAADAIGEALGGLARLPKLMDQVSAAALAMQQDGLHVNLPDMGMVESIHLCVFHWVLNDVYARINREGRHGRK